MSASGSSSSRRTWKREPLVLFVEGYGDLRFYAEMMEHVGLAGVFIQDMGGRTLLKKQAELLLKPNQVASMKSVGVVLDADSDAVAAFESARSSIRDVVGVDVTAPGQWVTSPTGVKFGIFIVGTGPEQPELESLAWFAWTSDSSNAPLRECVEGFIQCTEGKNIRLQSIDKVRVGAALSVLNEDDPRIGPAAQARLFDFEHAAFAELRTFFQGMT